MTFHVWRLRTGEIVFTEDESPLPDWAEPVTYLGTTTLPISYPFDPETTESTSEQ